MRDLNDSSKQWRCPDRPSGALGRTALVLLGAIFGTALLACSSSSLPTPGGAIPDQSIPPPQGSDLNELGPLSDLLLESDPEPLAQTHFLPPALQAPSDDIYEVDEPVPVPERAPIINDGLPRLYATSGLTRIYHQANRHAPIIGAFRAGQSVIVRDTNMTRKRTMSQPHLCTGGWYPVEPRGWVCAGGEGHPTFDAEDPRVVAAAAVLPDVSKGYPFKFGIAVGSPRYLRIPTLEEQLKAEPGLENYLKNLPAPDNAQGGAIDLTPAGQAPRESLILYLKTVKPPLLHDEKAFLGMKVSWSQEFDAHDRTWLVQPDMTFIPKDKVRVKPLPTLQGINLREHPDMKMPLAFVWLKDSHKHQKQADGTITPTEEVLERHRFIPASGKMERDAAGRYFWALRDGSYITYQHATILRQASSRPPQAGANDKWVDVRVTWGYLVAYEGDEPVFVTAMSPGIDGINPRKHATKRGKYRIGWKMLSADMSGQDKGKTWFVDEVPWVQYYKGNYALHGAWWHNDFGRPKSHGCINLAPADARHLFSWMDPPIPKGWYAATAYYPHVTGTLVSLRP